MYWFSKVTPVLLVSDLQRSLDFYTDVLRFQLGWRMTGDAGGEMCMIESGGVAILLSTETHLGEKPVLSGTLYIETQDVDEFFTMVKDRVELVWPLEDMAYGQREFGIRDPDGYTLAFAQPLGE